MRYSEDARCRTLELYLETRSVTLRRQGCGQQQERGAGIRKKRRSRSNEERLAKKKESEDELCGAVGGIFFIKTRRYRRIKAVLERQGRAVSEKAVGRAMRQLRDHCQAQKGKEARYMLGGIFACRAQSYQEEFPERKSRTRSGTPNLREFSIPAGKVCLFWAERSNARCPVACGAG